MARRLALVALVLVLGLALWLWKGTEPAAPPVAAPKAPVASEHPPVSAPTESAPTEKREQIAPAEPAKPASARLVVVCKAKGTGAPIAKETLLLCGESTRPARMPKGTGTQGQLGDSLATGPDGRVEFELPANTTSHLWVWDWMNGARPAQDGSISAMSAGERRELVIELNAPPENFCGRVIAREERTPIAGASVTDTGVEFTTDADGRFVLPASNSIYTIAADGFAEVHVAAQGGHETPEKAFIIELDRGGTLIGVLANPSVLQAREPLRFQASTDISRMLLPDPDATGGHMSQRGVRNWHADFDAAGRAVLADLPPDVSLEVAALEGQTKVLVLEDITLAPGEKREVKLDPSGACVLSGSVRDDADQPVAGLELWLLHAANSPRSSFDPQDERQCSAKTKSGDDGRFRIPGIAPGSWRLGPACTGRASGVAMPADAVAPVPTRIEIPEGTPALEVVLHVHRGISIRGHVLDEEDQPVRAGVTAIAGAVFVFQQADASGNFELGPLAPGSYTLQAESDLTFVGSETVEVEAGAQDVVLRVSRGATLAGQAVDSTTGAGVEAEIRLSRTNDPRMTMMELHSRADGSFEFGGLKPGTYTLSATMEDGRVGMLREIEVAAVSRVEGLRIKLAPGASLRVRYEGQHEVGHLKVLQDGALVTSDGVVRGKPARFRVPSGAVRLLFTIAGKDLVRDVTLAPGEEREVEFKDED